MSIMTNPRTFGRAINRRQGDDFARQRSRFLDIFSAAELRLAKLCLKTGLVVAENSTTGQRVQGLKLAKPSPTLSKSMANKIKAICADFEGQIKIRNGVVHADMSIGTREQEDVAFFQRTSDAAAGYPAYFVMSFDDFAVAIEKVGGLSQRLDELLTQPSSPPQPKQAAATGP
jgi:hypothetical protein